ncbi:putative transposase Ptta/En/Spm plant [Arabidopsis suecica]|uniref:Putative transposase Ptta/En/Spm plant n=1 Tax=Arabidopsis suecica TaxID=45249 RepID=A0A8T1YPE2_ARASU|nr:putative transposase Ptta/En/Spm plant [Arabidopsis suecica]
MHIRMNSKSQGNASRNCNPPSPASQNEQDGLSPPSFNPNSPNPSHSATQPPTGRLNDLTLEELLDSPRRQSLQRLDPNRPPGTLLSINQRVRDEFEDKLKDRMCDQISRWKGKWKNNGDEAKPKWIDPQVWAELVRFWRDPKSEIKNINSTEMPDIMIPMARSEETGDSTPYFLVVLEQTHRKADGTFIDRKSEEINKEVSSRIEEEESQLCSGDNTESSASGGLSVATKNKIYTQPTHYTCVIMSNLYDDVSSTLVYLHEVSSVNVGPPPTHNDPVVLSENLAAAEARLQSQAEKIHSFDAYFEYLAEKDIVFGGMYRGGFETENGNATRTAEDNGTRGDQTGTDQTGTETGNGTIPGSSPSQAF